jgi:hypothetical protein
MIHLPSGGSAPLYLIPFDKKGRCEGPKTLAHLLDAARSGQFNNIHVFSHGWNNVFNEALGLYREFFSEYFALRAANGIPESGYKPLLVGIVWPSTLLVSNDESTPRFAGDAPHEVKDAAFTADSMAARELASEIRDEDVARFHELTDLDRPITREEALDLARILLPIYSRDDGSGEQPPQDVTPQSLVESWEQAQKGSAVANPTGGAGALPADEEETGVSSRGPAAAGGPLEFLNPVNIVRGASVYQMKDRAGIVGFHGVGPLVEQLVATGARVHLTGHSFGGKVMLSALSHSPTDIKVRSVLLLQPAVNRFCFAENIDGVQGGYRKLLNRTELPIVTTFSSHDSPLSSFFHLGVRRSADLAEQRIAGAPSKYSALGGYGPAGLKNGEGTTMEIAAPPQKYTFNQPGVRVIALDGSNKKKINSHGDVRNQYTEWALVNLVAAGS